MDPTSTLCEALDAMLCNDLDSAADALEDLAGWLRGGGFRPTLTGAAVTEVLDRARKLGV